MSLKKDMFPCINLKCFLGKHELGGWAIISKGVCSKGRWLELMYSGWTVWAKLTCTVLEVIWGGSLPANLLYASFLRQMLPRIHTDHVHRHWVASPWNSAAIWGIRREDSSWVLPGVNISLKSCQDSQAHCCSRPLASSCPASFYSPRPYRAYH